MSKDYKQGGRRPSGGQGGGSSVLAGLLIGLCLGAAIAVAAAMYLNRIPNPFAGKFAPATAQPLPASAKPTTAAASPTPVPRGPEHLTFYEMLPQSTGSGPAATPKPVPSPKPADATPPVTVEPPKGIYLQAGSFQNEAEADNLKAKLAMLGVEASIQTTELKDSGVVHRVRVGPLASNDEIERVRAELKVNGIDPSIVQY